MSLRRRLIFSAVTLAAILVAAVPAVLAMLFHGERLRFTGDLGRGSAIYIVLTFVYLVWLPGTIVLLVWVFDHLGYQYSLTERKQRPTRKERRRLRDGFSLLASHPTFGQDRSEDAAAHQPPQSGRPPGSRPTDDRGSSSTHDAGGG